MGVEIIMINQPQLFRLFQARTGRSMYRVPALLEVRMAWQQALVKEYSIQKLR